MTFHPILIAVAIVAAVAMIGYLITYFQSRATMRGYEELEGDIQTLSKVLKAERFRDGADLVLSGNYGKFPAVVRFSYSDNTPGLNVRMKAPANFTLSVAPKGAKTTEGKVQVRTTEEMFDARFVTRTDHPTQARMFLSGKPAMASLQKLCCSSKTFFTVMTGSLELSELVIPSPYTAKHVSDHLDGMGKLGRMLASMPGADTVKVTPFKSERNLVLRTAIAVLLITGVLVMVSAVREHNARQDGAAVASGANQAPGGVTAADFQRLPGILGWRVATPQDFDSTALGWLGGQHRGEISGHITAAFAGEGRAPESAYVLIQEQGIQKGERRVIVLANNQVLFDAGYKSVAIAARVPKANFSGIEWQTASSTPAPPDGDGLLVVRKADDPKSGVILYASGGKLATALPANYQSVSVE